MWPLRESSVFVRTTENRVVAVGHSVEPVVLRAVFDEVDGFWCFCVGLGGCELAEAAVGVCGVVVMAVGGQDGV